MGRDNSARARQRKQLERREAWRVSQDRILIVSEGSKTEPHYFKEIRAAYRLRTASVEVRFSELGTAPIQVVQYGEQLFRDGDLHKGIRPRNFDQIYAVFDRDDHKSYFDALDLATSLSGKLRNDNKQSVRFKAIPSIPNFELWLLLHYEDIQAPLHRDEVVARLKKYIPGYRKGDKNAFSNTRDCLDAATRRAQALAERFDPYTGTDPYTAIFELVNILMALQKNALQC
jgi:hypothetical protein